MAKNKNRKHEPKQQRSARPAEHTREQTPQSSVESQPSSIGQPQGSSGDSGRRHQKRFGHN
jgi:hypothetical protein